MESLILAIWLVFMDELTEKQRQVFDFVYDKLTSRRPAPTSREIAANFGWSSKRAAECHIEAIMNKGWLTSDPGKARSLRLTDAAQEVHRALPVLGTIPAGFGSDREQETGDCIAKAIDSIGVKPTRNTFALRVSGDSMLGRHICDGDIVILEHGPDPRDGQIVAALIDRQSTLKTFLVENGKPFLKAENRNYPNLVPTEELTIQGIAIALIRRVES